MEEIDPFDLKRMFIGDFSALLTLEILVRTAFMYSYALVAVRFIGKRGIGSLSPFEYVLVFALGGATGDPMLYPEVPLVHGMIVITVIVALHKLVARSTRRNEVLEHLLESRPVLLVRDGVIDDDQLSREDLSQAELLMKLREAGIKNVGRVQLAYLEPSGNLSVFPAEQTRPGQSTLGADAT